MKVYLGTDPLTGKRLYLTESTTDEKEAERILTRLQAQVDDQRNARTRGSLRLAIDSWMDIADIEESTRESYEIYIRRYINPVLGDESVAKIGAFTLEQLYAQLRRCKAPRRRPT